MFHAIFGQLRFLMEKMFYYLIAFSIILIIFVFKMLVEY